MTAIDASQVASRVAQIRERINRAGGKDVEVIAVTKTFDVSAMIAAFDAGVEGIGENYAQELISKIRDLPTIKKLPIHFIGRLQTNKVKSLVDTVDVWQTVDRPELIAEIAKRCVKTDSMARSTIMLQVNSTNETDKGGCQPNQVEQLLQFALSKGLEVLGLMTVGPTDGDPQRARVGFKLVRKLADDLGLSKCSMGMTGDLEIAVGEGATMIRVGSALFGPRS
ncbi:MAG: YggS family pyridoxal phosphate-dependent enzyme [Actinobacteria bacterium]|nr:YggS family pyridoxal phosphate-dependent enzyme [Actinomycetota bacterium]